MRWLLFPPQPCRQPQMVQGAVYVIDRSTIVTEKPLTELDLLPLLFRVPECSGQQAVAGVRCEVVGAVSQLVSAAALFPGQGQVALVPGRAGGHHASLHPARSTMVTFFCWSNFTWAADVKPFLLSTM